MSGYGERAETIRMWGMRSLTNFALEIILIKFLKIESTPVSDDDIQEASISYAAYRNISTNHCECMCAITLN